MLLVICILDRSLIKVTLVTLMFFYPLTVQTVFKRKFTRKTYLEIRKERSPYRSKLLYQHSTQLNLLL